MLAGEGNGSDIIATAWEHSIVDKESMDAVMEIRFWVAFVSVDLVTRN